MEEKKNISTNKDELTLFELIEKFKIYWKYLLGKWLIILTFGLLGGAIGLVASLLTKPKYTAHLSFSLIDKTSGGGGLLDLASSFGIAGLGGGSGSAFSGDNLLEIIKSHYAIERTLLTQVNYKGKQVNLMEAYIEFSELRKDWIKETKHPTLQTLVYPLNQKRETFSRTQDSVLYVISEGFIKSNALSVVRKDKKVAIVNVDFSSKDEEFTKLFVENLLEQTYSFYRSSKIAQSEVNIEMMQHTADSVKALYEGSLYRSAGYSQVNINTALQYAAVPKIKNENNAQLYGAVYAEVLKNLETLKLDMSRETPIIQIIDTPRYPLKKERLGKFKGIVLGGVTGGFLIVLYLLGLLYIKDNLQTNKF